MKTPREILLARHEAAGPRLDAIRRRVVDELNNQETKEQSFLATFVSSLLGCSNKFWLELIWPCRQVWTGLAAIWVLLLVVNVAQRDRSPVIMARSQPTVAMLLAVRNQEKLLNELLADHSQPVEADRPDNVAPRPRSEISETVAI